MISTNMLSHEDYAVGWICALPLEVTAAKTMLDETHPKLSQPSTDPNAYTLGKVCGHSVVIACLPSGVYGTTSAATVVAHMVSTFPRIQFALMVGIGGGVPVNVDIRLGDVVVSQPTGNYSGVVQYDYGKTVSGGFQQTGMLNQPPQALLTSMAQLQADHIARNSHAITTILSERLEHSHDLKTVFACPGQKQDQLFHSTYDHVQSEDSCVKCDKEQLVYREPRASDAPQIHYGLIASGNQVIKDSRTRDRLARQLGIICFEMEAAGLMNQLPCLVIRGICDYSDSHKNKEWQGYAALTAAAYGRLLLSVAPVSCPLKTKSERKTEMTTEEKACLRSLFLSDPADDKNSLKRRKGDRAPGTCEWILETHELKEWLGSQRTNTAAESNILWLYGNPGTGKSTIAITMADELPYKSAFVSGDKTLAYFFCDSSSEERSTVTAILRGLLYQIIKQRLELMKPLLSKYEERKEKLFTSFDALWATLMDIGCNAAAGEIYCIIDALDECDAESQDILLSQVNQTFRTHNSKDSHLRIHILITSRPYPEIRQHLTEFRSKDLASYSRIKQDIQVLIRVKVKELSQKINYPENVVTEVSKILEEKAEGTFLWVGIACGELVKIRSRDAVKTLRNLPRGLHSLYQKLLDRALEHDEGDRQTIIQMLSFVAISRRPLSVAELSEACQLYQDEDEENRLTFTREDIQLCHLMIIVEDGIVRLLHKSMKDFLVGTRERHLINELKAHATLANQCIHYIINRPQFVRSIEYVEQTKTFLSYAVFYWPEHAASAQTEFVVLREHESFFQLKSDKRENWLRLHNSRLQGQGFSEIPNGFSIFHVAARWGITYLVHYALASMTERVGPGDSWTRKDIHFDDTKFEAANGVTPLAEAAQAGQIGVMALLLEKGTPKIVLSMKVLLAAAQNWVNGEEVMELLLKQPDDRVQITEDVVKAAAGNSGNGRDIMAILLDRQDQIQITEEVVKAAAGNNGNGRDIMAMLLDRRDQIQITEEVVKAAAGNWACGKDIIVLLLDRCEDQIQITEDVVKTAAGNKYSGEGIITLLLDRCRDQIQITKDVVMAAVTNKVSGKEVIAILLDRRGDQAEMTSETVVLICAEFDWGIVALLLDRCGDQIRVTEDVVKSVAGNRSNSKAVMALLLDRRGDQAEMTSETVALICSKFDWEIVALLLDRRGDQIQITEDVIKATAGRSGKRAMALLLDRRGDQAELTSETVAVICYKLDWEIVALLLDRYGDQIRITEDVVKAAAGNESSGRDIITLLLDRCEDQIQITEDVVKTAASNKGSGKDIITLLLDRCEDQVRITEDVVKATAENSGKDTMTLLLDRRGDQDEMTPETVAMICGEFDWKVIALLLDRRGDQIQIIDAVKAAARNWMYGKEVMARLLDRHRDQIQITEDVVKAAAGNRSSGKDIMALLLDRCGHQFQITEAIVKTAAANWRIGTELMTLLLDRCGHQFQITEAVVTAAAANWRNGRNIIALLLDRRGDQFQITENIVTAAAANWRNGKNIIALLLDRRRTHIQITEDVVKAAAGNEEEGHQIISLLMKRGINQIQACVNEGLLLSAASCGQERVLELFRQHTGIRQSSKIRSIARFYNAAKEGNSSLVRELLTDGIPPDTRNPRGITPLWIAATNGHEQVVSLLLQTSSVDVNSLSESGRPPIFWAASEGHIGIVRLLLQANANPRVFDENGDTPYSLAKQNRHFAITQLMEKL